MSSELPLDGIKVLDVSAVLAAPVAATMLGDFGADVVKVEQPGTGDFTRRHASRPGGRSLQWAQEGRNKRSVTLNLRDPRGRDVLMSMLPHFDVVVTNYRPPTLRRWGMSADKMREVNDRLIVLYITGYGLTGPYADRGAFDRVASAFAGLTYVSGYPESPPVRTGYALIDYMTAYVGAYAVMLALYNRDARGGPGQVIDLALYEAGFRASEDALLQFSVNGVVRERVGNRNLHVVPADDFETADGRRVAFHAGTDSLFTRLVAAMNRPDLTEDTRFATYKARVENQEDLYAVLQEWACKYGAEDLVALLVEYDIPASLVMSIADIAENSHYRERGTFVAADDPDFGRLLLTAPLPRLSETPGRISHLGPKLGEHNREIYQGLLGMTEVEIADLTRDGVI